MAILMVKRSSISSFSRLPAGCALFLLVALILELFVFSRSYMLADVSTIAVIRNSHMIEEGHDRDMLLLGASRSLAVNARELELGLDAFENVYNHSVPSLGTSLQFYMILEKYLDHNEKPRAILLSLGPEAFGQFRVDALFYTLWSGEAERFWRFFSLPELLRYMPFKEKIFIVPLYVQTLLNSYNYRMNLRDYLEYNLFGVDRWGVDDVVGRNRELLGVMDQTRGQLIYWPDRQVTEDEMIFENIVPLGGLAEYEYESYYLRKDENIRRFLHLATAEGIPVVVFFMPVPQPRYELMDKYGNFNYTRRRMREFEDKFKSVFFLDRDINYDMKYFGDSSHLNREGAAKFNREFTADLKQLLEKGYGEKDLAGDGLNFDIGAALEGRIRLAGFYEKEQDAAGEKSWRWSAGTASSLSFPWVRTDTERRFRISFEIAPFASHVGRTLVVGTPVDSESVVTRAGLNRYSVELTFPASEELHFSVAYENATSPEELGLSPDERRLAVRWFNVTLQNP